MDKKYQPGTVSWTVVGCDCCDVGAKTVIVLNFKRSLALSSDPRNTPTYSEICAKIFIELSFRFQELLWHLVKISDLWWRLLFEIWEERWWPVGGTFYWLLNWLFCSGLLNQCYKNWPYAKISGTDIEPLGPVIGSGLIITSCPAVSSCLKFQFRVL